MNRIGYRTDITPTSEERVTMGNRLQRAFGKSQQTITALGDLSDRDIQRTAQGRIAQDVPIGVKPTGFDQFDISFMDQTLQEWLQRSQMGTIYYGDIITPDPEDEKYGLMYLHVRDLQRGGKGYNLSGVPGAGAVFVQPEFWDYAKRKMDQEMEASYKLWKFQQIQLLRPAEREWWIAHNPEFITCLEAGKKRTLAIMDRLSDIRIKGVQSEEDLRDLYSIGKGQWNPEPKIPPNDYIKPYYNAKLSTIYPGQILRMPTKEPRANLKKED